MNQISKKYDLVKRSRINDLILEKGKATFESFTFGFQK